MPSQVRDPLKPQRPRRGGEALGGAPYGKLLELSERFRREGYIPSCSCSGGMRKYGVEPMCAGGLHAEGHPLVDNADRRRACALFGIP